MEPDRIRGVVINVHALGAAVRLEDGRLVAVSAAEVNRHRAAYTRSLERRSLLTFARTSVRSVTLAQTPDESITAEANQSVALSDAVFEQQIAGYLKETEAWAPADRPAPLERHLFKKKQRAKAFQSE